MVLVIDHEDSFVFNLARYIEQLGYAVMVRCHNTVSAAWIQRFRPSHVVLSPGPCGPKEAVISCQIVERFAGKIPILGVCLGHQIIGQVMGGQVVKAQRPLHGQRSLISHTAQGLFMGIENPCWVGRYHSLIVQETGLSPALAVTARSEEAEVMAIESQSLKLAGVQFHPESVLTTSGYLLLRNFLSGYK